MRINTQVTTLLTIYQKEKKKQVTNQSLYTLQHLYIYIS